MPGRVKSYRYGFALRHRVRFIEKKQAPATNIEKDFGSRQIMEYQGKYIVFNNEQMNTYPVSTRTNKVKRENIVDPGEVLVQTFDLPGDMSEKITTIAESIISARNSDRPVILFSGGHLIKNGLGSLLVDLVQRDMVTLVAGNGSTAIHDFELALIGETSEYVPQALEKGQFGMAYEFCYQNAAINLGDRYDLGYGESLGRMICDKSFREQILTEVKNNNSPDEFLYPHLSVLAACYEKTMPFTVHASLGTDVTDQHPSFDGRAKGGCSGRDFLIFTHEISKCADGGVLINIGSSVTGPEVALKAISMVKNVGAGLRNITTADFDLRPYEPSVMTDESQTNYYFRDQKSIVTRIPQAFGGQGYYIQGNQKETFPCLYQKIINLLE